jgi:hypothetical protein
MDRKPPLPPTANALVEAVWANHPDVAAEAALSMLKDTPYVRFRHECWQRLRELTDDKGRRLYTLAQIASWWGCRHSTVLKACEEQTAV